MRKKNLSNEIEPLDLDQLTEKKPSRNREFAVITYSFLALFIALCVYFGYYLGFRSETFINNPYNNARILNLSKSVLRGKILSKDGEVLAYSTTDESGNDVRVYPYGNTFAHVIGYDTNGLMGVELDSNFYLLRSHDSVVARVLNDLQNEKSIGDTVITTLDSTLQETVYDGMGNYEGAVVAIEPSTGKILCMISKPDFNPNTIIYDYEALAKDEDSSVFLNRATAGLYPPGSTFKMVTALEYLNEGGHAEDEFDCNGKYGDDSYKIHCVNNKSHGHQTLLEAFGNSCNVVFAQIGLTLDSASWNELSSQLLFNTDLPLKISNSKKSSFLVSEEDTQARTMQTAIGQGKTLVTPMHMALIASSVCNDGELYIPYVVDRVENVNGIEIESFSPESYGNIMSAYQANELEELMRYVVTDGTASALDNEEYTVYGKTGSAEYTSNKNETHSWFVGYAKQGDKEIAVAIVLEGAGSGSKYAVPLANKLFQQYFKE